MKPRSKTLLILILTGLLMANAAFAAVYKDEVVYVSLDPKGQPEQVYVINAFEADEAAEVTDEGRYDQVMPLKEAEGFRFQDNQAAFTMQPGRFSYQGNLNSTALPWLFDLSYTLNGQEVAADALSGAEGALDIKLLVKVNEDLRAYADALTLQITFTLDGDRSFNIESEKATYALAGGNRTLSFVVLPGQSAEYLITCQVRDYAMADVQLAGVRMGMDAQMYEDVAASSLVGSPFEGAFSGLMRNMMDRMAGLPLRSFTGDSNQVRSLQFVMMLRGIKPLEKENGQATANP